MLDQLSTETFLPAQTLRCGPACRLLAFGSFFRWKTKAISGPPMRFSQGVAAVRGMHECEDRTSFHTASIAVITLVHSGCPIQCPRIGWRLFVLVCSDPIHSFLLSRITLSLSRSCQWIRHTQMRSIDFGNLNSHRHSSGRLFVPYCNSDRLKRMVNDLLGLYSTERSIGHHYRGKIS